MTGHKKWKPPMLIVLVCVYGPTSCPDDEDLSCGHRQTELKCLFKYSGAMHLLLLKFLNSTASLYMTCCGKPIRCITCSSLYYTTCLIYFIRSYLIILSPFYWPTVYLYFLNYVKSVSVYLIALINLVLKDLKF